MSLLNPQRTHSFAAIAHPDFQLPRPTDLAETSHSRIASKSDTSRLTASGGRIFQFNFGGLAFWNATDDEIKQEISRLTNAFSGADIDKLLERYSVVESGNQAPRVDFNSLILDSLSEARAEVVASTLAQSSAMEYYEKLSDIVSSDLSTMVERLKLHGSVVPLPGRLHKKIGALVSMRGSVVGVLHLLDRPDLVWDDRIMDGLYNDLRTVFDLPERFQALEYKLSWSQDTLQILLDTARDRRLFWLEVAIVFFFAIEITISLSKLALG